MLKLYRYLCGLSSRSVLLLLVLIGSTSLVGCSKVAGALLTGGGPNVAANVQAGKTNTQTIGTTNVVEQKLVRPQANTIRQSNDSSKVSTENVESIVVNEVPVWVILLLIMGWLLPSPSEMGRGLYRLIRGEA